MEQNKNILNHLELSFQKLITPLINHPENLEVDAFYEHQNISLNVCAHYADQGRLIGKEKINFNAIQTIISLIGSRNGFNVRLNKLLPAKVGSAEFQRPFDPQADWPAQETFENLKEVLSLFLKEKFSIKVDEDDSSTTYTVLFSEEEKQPISSGQIVFSLSKIFHAIGRARGRIIYVTTKKSGKIYGDEAQIKS